MLRWGLRCPHCREQAASIFKKMLLLPPRQTACVVCGQLVNTPLLPLMVLDVLLIAAGFLSVFTDLMPFLDVLEAVSANQHRYYTFLSGLFFAAVAYAWGWTLFIPLTRPPEPLYVPRLHHFPPRLHRRR